jgi:glycosyltransferase involved in cell wall biosynthesis
MVTSVSVIIPTYNRAHLVHEAIDSVLAQDVEDCSIEIIVVDDGSMDDTSHVVQRYGSEVKYIHQSNQGAGVARNRGIEEATGEWVAFLDSDDRWLAHKLSLQFRVLRAFPELNVIHSNFYTFEEDRIIIPKGLEYWVQCLSGTPKVNWADIYSSGFNSSDFQITHEGREFGVYAGNIFGAQLQVPCVSCWTLLVRRECLESGIRFAENFSTWEDYWFICKLSEKQDFIFIDTPTAENRSHAGPRLTGTRPAMMLKCHIDTIEGVYFKSGSAHRPSTDRIKQVYRDLHLSLFKEYVKSGDSVQAKAVLEILRRLGIPNGDLDFYLYRLASFLPTNVLQGVRRIKGIFERVH